MAIGFFMWESVLRIRRAVNSASRSGCTLQTDTEGLFYCVSLGLDKGTEDMVKTYAVTLLRILIGGFFFYEGLYKLVQPVGWSAEGCLRASRWFAAPVFHFVASTPGLLKAVNLVGTWGVALVGLMLIVGLLTRTSSVAGLTLLALSYIAQPPFLSPSAGWHFAWVDRTVIVSVAMVAVMLIPSYGLDRFLASLPRRAFKRKLAQEKSNQSDA
jgi:uncharacterized membrane protein YphA (DoxX/SURF4 family)